MMKNKVMGRPKKSRKLVNTAITLYPDEIKIMDEKKGEMSRGEWIRSKLGKHLQASKG